MNTYAVRYLSGPQSRIVCGPETFVRADSIDAALAQVSPWPVEHRFDSSFAWAKHPGTSLYHVEAWEARLADDSEAAA